MGDDGDRAAGNDLAGEDDAAAELARDHSADVVAEVDFGGGGMAGDAQAEEADVFDLEADDADVGLAVVEVGFGAGGREALDDLGRDGGAEETGGARHRW